MAHEVLEETSLKVEVVRPVFFLFVENDGQKLVFLCKYLGGEPVLGNYNEKKVMEILKDGSQVYEPQWVFVSHDRELVEKVCDKNYILAEGILKEE